MKKLKIQPFLSKDGRLYFNYNVGAKYVLLDRKSQRYYTLEIVNAEYVNGTEYYSVLKNKVKLPGKLTVNRLHYLFNFELNDVICKGKKTELPLTEGEVVAYYAAGRVERSIKQEKIKEILSKTEFFAIESMLKALRGPQLAFAEAKNNADEVQRINNKIYALEKQRCEILNEHRIDADILSNKSVCLNCDDMGIKNGQICKCALKKQNAIKTYCANLRIR